MDKYYSMFEVLSGINLYRLTGTSTIDAELWAYSVGYSLVENELQEFIRESTLATAETWGLSLYGYLPWIPESATLSEKRKMLLARNNILLSDFTKAGMEKCLAVFGIVADIQETLGDTNVIIRVFSAPSTLDASKICALAEVHLSSHLAFECEFAS